MHTKERMPDGDAVKLVGSSFNPKLYISHALLKLFKNFKKHLGNTSKQIKKQAGAKLGQAK